MLILKAMDLHKEWNGTNLFKGVTFEVGTGERLALFGRNGTGKTTLLQGLLGRTTFQRGQLQRLLPIEEWGWMDQQADECSQARTVLNFTQYSCGEVYEVKRQLAILQSELETNQGQALENTLEKYSHTYERYLQLQGFEWEIKVEKCLGQMGIGPELWELPFEALSGGQKTRVQLAALMVREPQFIILDEPTNHLDEKSLEWLETWLCEYEGTVLYVSHDREFIDRTATAVLELEPEGCRRYPGGYTDYVEQKKLELRTQETLYSKQEQARKALEESIRNYREWFHRAERAVSKGKVEVGIMVSYYKAKANKNISRYHAKQKELERLNDQQVQKPREAAKIKMEFSSEAFAANTLLRFEGASFDYNSESYGLPLLNQLHLEVNRGDRLAVIGPNGAGKSTFMQLASGLLTPVEGTVAWHPQTKIGYFAQELEHLDNGKTILDSMLELPDMTQSYARTILGCFLFSRDDVFKVIGDLSMGEKCRVAFLKLYFGRYNMLILDEPTNYLDVDTRERVEEALCSYPGALMIVTHDRYLTRKVANRLLFLERGKLPRIWGGTYEEYESLDRERVMTSSEQVLANEKEMLELRLTQLISSGESEGPDAGAGVLQEIRELQRAIAELERKQGK